ncbi:MAG: type II toxin-antitoxin system VapC family toxin [Terrimicrobiaceae bacterium]
MKAWVVDTCVVLDVALNDAVHGVQSAQMLQNVLQDGLVICGVTFVELAPAFGGKLAELKRFLIGARIGWEEPWTLADTETAHDGWWRQVCQKRQGIVPRRPVADLLIGAFACRARGLITRNPHDFQRFYPDLNVMGAD